MDPPYLCYRPACHKEGGEGGTLSSQVRQILFKIDILHATRGQVRPIPPAPLTCIGVGQATEGGQNCQIQKKIEKGDELKKAVAKHHST